MTETIVTSTEYDSAMSLQQKIVEGMEMQGDEFETWKSSFINQRLSELRADSWEQEFDSLTGYTNKFLSSTAEIKPLFIGRGFMVDDDDIYHQFLDTLHDFYERNEDFKKPNNFKSFLLYGVQYGLQAYFGNMKPSSGDQALREERLLRSGIISNDDNAGPEGPRSIRENKSEAMCAERAAVAHNLLKLADWESAYYVGKLSIDDSDADLHAFIIYKTSRGTHNIFDPMNPEVVEDADGKTISGRPAVYYGGDEILDGQPVVVNHARFKLDGQEYSEIDSQTYRYFNNPLIAMKA